MYSNLNRQVNNAGESCRFDIDTAEIEDLDVCYETLLKSVFMMRKLSLPYLDKTKGMFQLKWSIKIQCWPILKMIHIVLYICLIWLALRNPLTYLCLGKAVSTLHDNWISIPVLEPKYVNFEGVIVYQSVIFVIICHLFLCLWLLLLTWFKLNPNMDKLSHPL